MMMTKAYKKKEDADRLVIFDSIHVLCLQMYDTGSLYIRMALFNHRIAVKIGLKCKRAFIRNVRLSISLAAMVALFLIFISTAFPVRCSVMDKTAQI